MKKTIILSFLFFANCAKAQSFTPCMQLQFGGSMLDSTNFDNSTSQIKIEVDTSFANNIWQIGGISKAGFPAAISGINALQTDTVNTYPIKNISAVNVYTTRYSGYVPNFFSLSFMHYYNVDTLKDSCIIQFTIDSGKTWNNIYKDQNVASHNGIDYHYNGSLDNDTNFHYTDNIAFTGKSNGWQKEQICFYFFGIKTNVTMDFAFRFLLKSDSINTNKPGWVIDDVKMYTPTGSSGINDIKPLNINIFPNPSSEFIIIDAQNESSLINSIELYNTVGQEVLHQQLNTNNLQLSTKTLPAGIYSLQITLADGRKGVMKIVKE